MTFKSSIHAAFAALLMLPLVANGQTTPIQINQGTYLENFNGMGTTVSVYPVGWNGFKISGSGSLSDGGFINSSTSPALTASDGSSNADTVFNFGSSGNTDRSLGSVAGPTTVPGFGVVLVNNTGRVLTASDLNIAFRAEQWRTGSANTTDEVWTFQYRISTTTIDVNDPSSAGWTELAGFNLNEIQTSASGAGPIDGNAIGNFVNVSGTLAGLVWNPGDRLVLRWMDANHQGSDAGMSVDDFSFTVFAPVPEPSTTAMIAAATASAWLVSRRRSGIRIAG